MSRMSRGLRTLASLMLITGLTGCMGLDQVPRAERDPIYGLGQSAARLLDEQSWTPPLGEQVLLLAPPEVDASLEVQPGALNEALTRALLALKDGPQVLNWSNDRPGIDSLQWRLVARLDTSGGPLRLSDRTLQPYQLTLELVRRLSAERQQTRTFTLSGAFDQAALDALASARPAS
ncbi:hypothetical protein OW493_07430 [Cobetia sp. 14N.309.X.WAT.E.A4]|uniref:hypothetical protein n=1 Tax=unclassified Cobetia TaxID=2609414 RepID=UPI001596945A|nr:MULTISPECIES: hypothetical protein [unclassified Cobetia]MDH2374329.1 hypothetical protein [Cobetia sp. 3AK]MDN2656276.1 hypothetical protein [Cobetia sp. 14N.309.X.WAT.E.A4]